MEVSSFFLTWSHPLIHGFLFLFLYAADRVSEEGPKSLFLPFQQTLSQNELDISLLDRSASYLGVAMLGRNAAGYGIAEKGQIMKYFHVEFIL